MAVSAIQAGKAFIEISARDQKLQDTLKADEQRMKAFVSNAAKIGATLAAGAVVAGLKRFADLGDTFDALTKRTGFTVEALSELKFAAEQNKSSLDALERGIKGMARFLLEAEKGSKEYVDTLNSLGLTYAELKNQAPEELFNTFADAVAAVDDPTRKAALAMKLFGRAGVDLIPFLNQGAKGIAEYRKEAREAGLSMSGEQAQSAAALTDAWNKMTRALEMLMVKVGAEFAPMMTQVAEAVAMLAANNFEAVSTVVKLALAIGTAVAVAKVWSVTLALIAKRQAIVMALSGPKGWAVLAAAAGVATVALKELDTHMGKTAEASDALNKELNRQPTNRNAFGRFNINEQAAGQLADMASGARKAADSLDELTAKEERLQAIKAELADNTATVAGMMDKEKTSAEKLAEQLAVLQARAHLQLTTDGDTDDTFDFDQLADLRKRLIDRATGFGTEVQKIRDEIGLLNGELTKTDIKLRQMAEKGLPQEQVEQLRGEFARLDAARQADEQRKAAADARQRQVEEKADAREKELETLQAGADEIRDAMTTPAERFSDMIANMQQMINEGFLDRDTADSFVSKRLADMEHANQRRSQEFMRQNSADLRSQQGASLLASLFGNRGDQEKRLLDAQKKTAENTKKTAKALEDLQVADI